MKKSLQTIMLLIAVHVTTAQSITVLPVNPNTFCVRDSFTFQFLANGTYVSTNHFVARLSDATGSFSTSTFLGFITGTMSGTITCIIPASVSAGTHYRVGVVSDNPLVIGNDNGTDITINSITPTVSVSANTGNIIAPGTSVTYTASYTNGGSSPVFQWQKNDVNVGTNSTIYVDSTIVDADVVKCIMTSNDAGCLSVDTATASVTMVAGLFDDWRTTGAGSLWDDTTTGTWERFNGTFWQPMNFFGPSASANNIYVRHPIRVNSRVFTTFTADQLQILPDGMLILNSDITFNVLDGPGTDMKVLGSVEQIGTLGGSGTVEFKSGSRYDWLFGTMTGTGTTVFQAGSDIRLDTTIAGNPGSNKTIGSTRSIINNGTIDWSSGFITMSGGGATFNNNGVINMTAHARDFSFNFGTQSSFNNNTGGVINKLSNTTQEINHNWDFQNHGTIHIAAGMLSVYRFSLQDGTIDIDAAATMEFTGGNTITDNSANAIYSGNGNINLNVNENFQVNTPVTVNFNSNTVNFVQGGVRFSGTGIINFNSGSTFNWNMGSLTGTGTTNFNAGSIISWGGADGKFLIQRTINNNSTINWTGGAISFQGGNGGIINNNGIWNFGGSAGDFPFLFGTPGAINNNANGVINKNTSASQMINNNWQFNNAGVLNVNANTLDIENFGSIQTGVYNLAAGSTFTGAPLSFQGSSITNNGSIALTGLTFAGSSNANLSGTGSINIMTLNGSGGVTLGGNQTINNSIAFTNGKITLGNSDLLLQNAASLSGGNANSFCVATGNGSLQRRVSNNNTYILFPVGTSTSYLPAQIQLTAGSTPDDFKVRLHGSLFGTYDVNDNPTSGVVSTNAVNRTWVIKELVAGGSDATTAVQWNATDESAGFVRSASRFGHFNSGAWNLSTATAAGGNNPYSLSRSSVTSFSPFGVVGQFASCTNSFGTVCIGSGVNIPYSAIGSFNDGNVFTAQLSDANGSFNSPITIGTNISTAAGTISAIIPNGTAAGNGYRIRIASSNPSSYGSDNGTNISISPVQTYYADIDGDGFGNEADVQSLCAPSGIYTTTTVGDCNDNNPNVHNGASEILNGIDDDCNGLIDDGLNLHTFYRDADGDGFGNAQQDTLSENIPAGFVSDNADCDDDIANIHPGAQETCNGLDDDCDGLIDADDPSMLLIPCESQMGVCQGTMRAAFLCQNGEWKGCRDTVNPIASYYYNVAPNFSTEESCDGLDNDCNGLVDLPVPRSGANACQYFVADADGDGYGNLNDTICACSPIGVYTIVLVNGILNDCNDNNAAVHPNAVEICDNGIDDNCNGMIDEGRPTTAGTISGPTGICVGSTLYTYSVPPITNATTYEWIIPNGMSGGSGVVVSTSPQISVNISSSFVTSSISVRGRASCGYGQSSSLLITKLTTAPSTPGTVNGTTSVCASDTQIYTIAAVTNANSYLWTPPANASIISGQGTTSVTVAFNPFYGGGILSVRAVNCIGQSAVRNLTINKKNAPALPGNISGTASACEGDVITYSIATITNASSYIWIAPANSTILSGQGTTSVTVQYTTGFSGDSIKVAAINCTGTSNTKSKFIAPKAKPATPGSITGVTRVCESATETYSIAPVANALSYTWTVPASGTLVSGQGTISIQIQWSSFLPTSMSLSVSASNCGGTSALKTIAVYKKSIPGTPGVVTGNTIVCPGDTQVYSIAPVLNATSYNWSMTGATVIAGQGTTIATIVFPSNYSDRNLVVNAINCSGWNLFPKMVLIKRTSTPAVHEITGLQYVCWGDTQTYHAVTSGGTATSYNWLRQGLMTILSGQGTSNVTVRIDSGYTGGTILARASNCGGTSVLTGLNIFPRPSPAAPGTINGATRVCPPNDTRTYSITPVSGVSSYTWSVSSPNMLIVSGQGTTSVEVIYLTGFTSGYVSVTADGCAVGSAQSSLLVNRFTIAYPTFDGNNPVCPGDTGNYIVHYLPDNDFQSASLVWTASYGGTMLPSSSQFAKAIIDTTTVISVQGFACETHSLVFSKNVNVVKIPPSVFPVSGNTSICPGSSELYSVTTSSSADTYTWIVPAGATGGGTGTLNNRTIGFPLSFTTGQIQVYASNCAGDGSTSLLTINKKATPALPSAITGPKVVCPGDTASYSSNGSTWSLPVTVQLLSESSSGSVSTIIVKFLSGFASDTIKVRNQICANVMSADRILIVGTSLATPGTITGTSAGVCAGVTNAVYSIAAVTGATHYTWVLPSGITLVSGQGTTSVIVNIATGFVTGDISVFASNSCAVSAVKKLTVVGKPTTPGIITGDNTPCTNTTSSYSIAPVSGATTYTWTAPLNGSVVGGQGTTLAQIHFDATNGNVGVTAGNSCGTSAKKNLAVTIDMLCSPAGKTDFTEQEKTIEEVTATGFNQLQISPNPSTDEFKISFEDVEGKQITFRLLDVTGRLVKEISLLTISGINEFTLHWNDEAKAVYILHLECSEQVKRLRVVKE